MSRRSHAPHPPLGARPTRAGAEASVQSADAVVSLAEKPVHGLPRQQCEEPLLRRSREHSRGLEVVVFRGDQHVDGVWRLLTILQGVDRTLRDGGLQKCRLRYVFDDKGPWRVIEILRREAA
jgi:hypothetical protein